MINPGGAFEYRDVMLGKVLFLVELLSAAMMLSSEAILRQPSCPPLVQTAKTNQSNSQAK